MEITFQNKPEDLQPFYDYVIRETEQGRVMSSQAFRMRQIWTLLASILTGALIWGLTGQWKSGLSFAVVIFLTAEALLLLMSGFNLRYHDGMQVYKEQEKSMTAKELQSFYLPRTVFADNDWLEFRNSEAIHRYKWRTVDRVSVTSNFIFIHIGTWPIVYIPRRDFPSVESFMEFGKKLSELREKHKDQPIGLE